MSILLLQIQSSTIKTAIVIKDGKTSSFDFLGHTFMLRAVKSKIEEYFTRINSTISNNAKKKIVEKINSWDVNQWVGWALLADKINPIIRGG